MEDGSAGGGHWAAGIERVAGVNGVGFRLPCRDHDVPGGIVFIMFVFGVLFCSIGLESLRLAFSAGVIGWWKLIPVFCALMFVGGGSSALIYALLLIVPSHAVVELERDGLVAHDWIGPIRITRRRRGTIDAIKLSHPEYRVERAGQKEEQKDDELLLEVILTDGRTLRLAHFYDEPVLRALAAMLSETISAVGMRTIEVREERPDDPMNPGRVLPRPMGSGMLVEEDHGRLWIETPMRGYTGGLVAFLLFGVFFGGLPTLLLVGALSSVATGASPPMSAIEFVILTGTLGFFAMIGFVMILAAVASARAATRIEVDDHWLVVTVTGLGRPRVRAVERAEIAAVGVQLIEIGGETTSVEPRLRIHFHRELLIGKRKCRMIEVLDDRSSDEMVWVAAELRRYLGVPSEA